MEYVPKSAVEELEACETCACISLDKMLHTVLMCKSKLMDNNMDKMEIYRILGSIEFDILLLNDENNFIERNLRD